MKMDYKCCVRSVTSRKLLKKGRAVDEKQANDEAYYHQTIAHFEDLCHSIGVEHIANSLHPVVAYNLMLALKARVDI